MDKFVHDENLKLFRKRLAETNDEKQRQVIHDLIAEHEAIYREWQLRRQPRGKLDLDQCSGRSPVRFYYWFPLRDSRIGDAHGKRILIYAAANSSESLP